MPGGGLRPPRLPGRHRQPAEIEPHTIRCPALLRARIGMLWVSSPGRCAFPAFPHLAIGKSAFAACILARQPREVALTKACDRPGNTPRARGDKASGQNGAIGAERRKCFGPVKSRQRKAWIPCPYGRVA